MSVYSTPEEHAANPPDTWRVVKAADRVWHLVDQQGGTLETATTRKACEAERTDGWLRRLYDTEGRWYAGEAIPHWKPWTQCLAERERIEAAQRASAI